MEAKTFWFILLALLIFDLCIRGLFLLFQVPIFISTLVNIFTTSIFLRDLLGFQLFTVLQTIVLPLFETYVITGFVLLVTILVIKKHRFGVYLATIGCALGIILNLFFIVLNFGWIGFMWPMVVFSILQIIFCSIVLFSLHKSKSIFGVESIFPNLMKSK
jgi:hypothetical protein